MEYFLGNQSLKSAVLNMVKSGNIPNSMLITGERGIGKKTAAKYLAAAIVCKEKSGVPCGKCNPCRKVFGNIHPDVITLFPGKNGNYLIDSVRDLRRDCAVMPGEAERKIYIIDSSEKMNLSAANAFLKCLEDPPQHTVFILLAEDEKKLIPTILSRTVRFRVCPVSKEDFTCRVGKSENYDLSGGNIGLALAREEDNENTAQNLIDCILCKNSYEFMRIVNSMGYMASSGVERILSEMTVIMKNALLYKSGISADEVSKAVGKKMSEGEIYAFLDNIEEMKERNTRNVSAQGIFTYLFLGVK